MVQIISYRSSGAYVCTRYNVNTYLD